MYRAVTSLSSNARIARNSAQQVSGKLSWSYAAEDIRFGVDAPALMLRGVEKILRRSLLTPCIFSSYSTSTKSKLAPLQERKMVDRFRLYAKAGDGGNGCCSFRRSRHERYGTPDGGNGGRGGDVILECSPTVWDFSSVQHHINAKRGGHGSSKNKIGTRGSDKIVQVPVGTVIHLVEGELPFIVEKSSTSIVLDPWDIPGTLDADQPETDEESTSTRLGRPKERGDKVSSLTSHMKKSRPLSTTSCPRFPFSNKEVDVEFGSEGVETGDDISEPESEEEEIEETNENEEIEYNVAELTKQGQRVIVACGGDGGLGNLFFPKVPKNIKSKKPGTLDHELSEEDQSALRTGSPGSQSVLILELKSIADVGLVGMPNAGKSTLLGAISRAQPIVGHYAFTTMRPNLGKVNCEDFSIIVADIPGLIKGAHENRGLGHAFLRHIERTKVIAYVLDLASGLDGRKGIPPWEQLRDLVLELEYHLEGLSARPSIIVANKIDEEGTREVYNELKRRVHGIPIYPVCAVLQEGIPELKEGLRMLVDGGESCGLRFPLAKWVAKEVE